MKLINRLLSLWRVVYLFDFFASSKKFQNSFLYSIQVVYIIVETSLTYLKILKFMDLIDENVDLIG
jgi:hypothetical protein